MITKSNRRSFLRDSATSLAALGGMGAFTDCNVARAQRPASRRSTRDLESVMRLIESTPRYEIAPVMVDQLRKGLTRDDLLAALFMTTARISQGHNLWVHHSVSELSSRLSRQDCLLPLFWHIDLIKSVYSGSPYPTLKGSQLPKPAKAAAVFRDAVRELDQDTAAAAIIAIARSEGPKAACRHIWSQAIGARLFGSIGHAAIRVANTWRSMENVGWQEAEHILYGNGRFCSSRKPLRTGDLHRVNAQRAAQHARLPGDWTQKRSDAGAVVELHGLFRESSAAEACDLTFRQLRSGKLAPASIWDAIFLTTNELSARTRCDGAKGRSGHAITGTNALHFIYRSWNDPETRLFTMLQAVGLTCSFVDSAQRAGELNDLDIMKIAEVETAPSAGDAVSEIFSLLPPRRHQHLFRDRSGQDKAMELTFAMAKNHSDQEFLRTARRLLCLKNSGAHHLKFSVAAFENYRHVSPRWRPHCLAASVFVLQGTQLEDNHAVQQARQALRDL